MAFPSDTERFYLLGPGAATGDEGVFTQVNVGLVIGPDENAVLVSNAHSNYTTGRRAFLVSVTSWGFYGSGSQTPVCEEASAVNTIQFQQVIHVSKDRMEYTYFVDSEDADWQIDLYNLTTATTEDTVTLIGSGGREHNGGPLVRTGGDSDQYVVIFWLSTTTGSPANGKLYGFHLIEQETAT